MTALYQLNTFSSRYVKSMGPIEKISGKVLKAGKRRGPDLKILELKDLVRVSSL